MKAEQSKLVLIWPILLLLCVLTAGCDVMKGSEATEPNQLSLSDVPVFQDSPYVELNGNEPLFTDEQKTTKAFEQYSELDRLGRCGSAYACIGRELMPTEERGSIGQIKPTGWHTVKYDFVDGKYLYNRCHLIGFQLTAENANEKNLITGTRYMNVEGMLPFENMVADYVKETDHHVLYRVTPIYEGENLVASGVEMEALSVEDNGEGVCFHVYVYNNQPGVTIDYKTGESRLSTQSSPGSEDTLEEYVLNTSSRKFHLPTCTSVNSIKEENKEIYQGSRDKLMAEGYEPCKNCNP